MKKPYREKIYHRYVGARYTAIAPDSVKGFAPRARLFAHLIRSWLPVDRNVSILDLGCGHGALVYALGQAGYKNVQGIDVSPEQVAKSAELGIPGIRRGDLLETLRSLPSESQDVCIAFDVMEHLTKDETLFFAEQIFRVLTPTGRLIIHAPNGESPFCGAVRYGDFTHEQAFTRTSIAQILFTSGFATVACHESPPLPGSFFGTIRWLLWKLLSLGLRFFIAVETGDYRSPALLTRNLFGIAVKEKGHQEK